MECFLSKDIVTLESYNLILRKPARKPNVREGGGSLESLPAMRAPR